ERCNPDGLQDSDVNMGTWNSNRIAKIIRAASEGKSLKSFIENLLVMEANAMSDEELYHLLVKNKPQGDVYLNDTEQREFENGFAI
ncbi:MAG: hypothetical protein LBE91_07655, partial [Tannerella sp.]|nr:hypothetical protein [Tannerella sp.]